MANFSIQFPPYLFQPKKGLPIAAEKGFLCVPENRQNKNSNSISIPFVRFRSTSANPGTPIIFLQGGPGESVLSDLATCWERPMWKPPLDIADSIFIEQRGSGLSQPCLSCPGTYDVPLDEPGSATLYQNFHSSYITNAIHFWKGQGIDINGYNVKEMTADINDLRLALGYDKISLLGGSFGSHHGFALLRDYSPFIEKVFLFGIEGPNHTIKLPGNVQKHLENVNRLFKKEKSVFKEIPDLLGLMDCVLQQLENQPVTVKTLHPRSKENVFVTIGKYDLQLITSKGMGSTQFLQELPLRYLAINNGDFSWLAEKVILERIGIKSNIMYEATDCASGASKDRKKQISDETTSTLLGNTINEPFHELSDIIGNCELDDSFRSEITSNVEIMLVCGSLDVRTPISNAKELLPGLPNCNLLTIEGVSHDLSIYGDHIEDFTQCRDQFFRGDPVKSKVLKSSFHFKNLKELEE